MAAPLQNPDLVKQMLLNGGVNPLYGAQQPDPSAPPPPPDPQRGSIAAAMPQTPQAAPTQAAPRAPMSQQEYAASPEAQTAEKAFTTPRPVGDFDTGAHPALRHALGSLFAGMAEFGRPGSGMAMADRWNQQATEQRQYDANQPKMAAGALAQAYNQYLQQQKTTGEIEKAPYVTPRGGGVFDVTKGGFVPGAEPTEKPSTPEQQFIDAETKKGVPLEKAVADYAKASHPEPAQKTGTPEQQFIDAERGRGVPLEKAVADYAKASHQPQQEPGSYMPLYDEHGRVTGAWNAKTGHIAQAPQNMPGTTSAGASIESKATAATTKEQQPYQQMVDNAAEAHNLAAMAEKGNASADVDLTLSFFKMMKGTGGAGVRFTQQEQNMILGARNAGQGLVAIGQKVLGEGQPLTPEQRQNMVAVMDMHAKAAQQHLSATPKGQGGGTTGKATENDPLGIR